MSKWTDFSLEERKAMVQGVVDACHIDEPAAEKDWWVTAVLYALFHTSVGSHLLFKGGTSLSKGWNLISRFSEDVDLAFSRRFFREELGLACAECRNNTQEHKFREAAQDYFFTEFKEELSEQLHILGLDATVKDENEMAKESGAAHKVAHDKDPSVLFVCYNSLYTTAAPYAVPMVKVEISVLSMDEPYEERRISSLIEQVYHEQLVDDSLVQTIKTVSPARTFLEKVFLLCEEYQKPKPRTLRMSRHLYDLEKLASTPYADQALDDGELYLSVVEHRRKYYHVGSVDYSKELPGNIQIVPPANLLKAFETDYADMRESFIYRDALDFPTLMVRIAQLQERFQKVVLP